MAKYRYGKKFKKNGRLVQYRYLNGRKSTKTLVYAKSKKIYSANPGFIRRFG